MRRAFVLVLAAGCLLVSGSRSAAAQAGGMRSVDFDGVSFRYDASLAGGVVPKLMRPGLSPELPYLLKYR